MLRKFLFVTVALTLAACAGDKYPYAPQYVAPAQINAAILPEPYAVDSPAWKRELNTVIAAQKKATAADIAQIRKEDAVIPQMQAIPVLGSQFNPTNYPVTYELLKKAGSDSWRIGDSVKAHYSTPRPWVAAPQQITILAAPISNGSYPSGHTTTNFTWAAVLSELMPQYKADFYKQAEKVAQHRVMAGAHFPQDVAGGRLLAKEIVTKMVVSPAFQKDLQAARAEIAAKPITKKHCHCCKKGHCPRKR